MRKIVLLITNYKSNHKGFYDYLINNSFRDSHLDVLICEPILLDQNEFKNAELHLRPRSTVLSSFLNSKRDLLRKSDIIVFEELYTFPKEILFEIIRNKNKSLLIVHNSNKFFNRDLKFNLKSIIAYFFFKSVHYYIKGIIVVSKTVKEHILENRLFNKNVYYIPFTDINVDFQTMANPNSTIKFTIPGTVNIERRNYKLFLEVFLRILKEHPEFKIELCLLGKIVKLGKKERSLIENIRKINPAAIATWSDFINDDTFHKELLNTNYLVGNINVYYNQNSTQEVYGQSKETGVLFIMLQYKIPTLFPDNYNYSEIYGSNIITYNNSHHNLYTTILDLLNNNFIKKKVTFNDHDKLVKEEVSKLYNDFLSAKN